MRGTSGARRRRRAHQICASTGCARPLCAKRSRHCTPERKPSRSVSRRRKIGSNCARSASLTTHPSAAAAAGTCVIVGTGGGSAAAIDGRKPVAPAGCIGICICIDDMGIGIGIGVEFAVDEESRRPPGIDIVAAPATIGFEAAIARLFTGTSESGSFSGRVLFCRALSTRNIICRAHVSDLHNKLSINQNQIYQIRCHLSGFQNYGINKSEYVQ